MADKETNLKSLEFVEAAGAGLKAAEFIADQLEAQNTKLAAAAPGLAKRMVQLGLIDGTEEKQATALLSDPVEVQNILGRYLNQKDATKVAAAESTVKKAGVDGTAVPDHTAAPTRTTRFIGARGGREKMASDNALLKLAGR